MALIALPDIGIHERTLLRLTKLVGPVLQHHHSGRPWIIGNAKTGTVVAARGRHLNVVVTGHTALDSESLAKNWSENSRIDRADALAHRVVEFDSLLFVHDGKQLRVYAPPFQSRSVFWTEFHGVTIVSDEQLPLASLNSFELDSSVLAARLVNAEVSHPFVRRAIWKDVDALGVGEYLSVVNGRDPRRMTWWAPPAATESISALAPALGTGIEQALSLRVGDRSAISSDLSGGLDSTTLSFYLANERADLHTLFMSVDNHVNNDWRWSERAAKEMDSQHITIRYESALQHIADNLPVTVKTFPEGPSAFSTTIASAAALEPHLRSTGSTLHLNGHAGDALFGQVSSMMWSYVRSNDPGRFRWLWRYKTLNRVPPTAMLKLLTARSTFSGELTRIGRGEYRLPKHDEADYSSWIQTPVFTEVFTQQTRDEVARFARAETANGARELSADRTTNQILSYLAAHGTVVRRMNHASSSVQFDSPYLDRRIVEPALALNHRERTVQSPIKPLLAAARPPAMSADYFVRQDKGDYTAEVFEQRHAALERVTGLFADGSILGEMRLVDNAAIARLANAYSPDGASYSDIIDLEFAEQWLRNVRDVQVRTLSEVE